MRSYVALNRSNHPAQPDSSNPPPLAIFHKIDAKKPVLGNKNGWTSKQITKTIHIPSYLPIPKSVSWCLVKSNIRSEDNPEIKHIPYLEEEDDEYGIDLSYYDTVAWTAGDVGEVVRECLYILSKKYVQADPDYTISLEMENITRSASRLELKLMQIFGISAKLLRKCLQLYDIEKLEEIQIDNYVEENKSKLLISSKQANKELFCVKSIFKLDAYGVSYARNKEEKEFHPSFGIRNDVSTYQNAPDSIYDTFCRRCFMYDCQLHGIMHPRPNKHIDPPIINYKSLSRHILYSPDHENISIDTKSIMVQSKSQQMEIVSNSVKSGSVKKKHQKHEEVEVMSHGRNANVDSSKGSANYSGVKKQKISQLEEISCEKSLSIVQQREFGLYKSYVGDSNGKSYSQRSEQISKRVRNYANVECRLASKLIEVFGHDRKEDIALCIGTIEPNEVDVLLNESKKRKLTSTASTISLNTSLEQENTSTSLSPTNKQLYRIRKEAKEAKHRIKYIACSHVGPCTPTTCPCWKKTGYCEKYCGCNIDCKIRYEGCTCKVSCSTNSCKCKLELRECDPDLCLTCGVCIHPSIVEAVNKTIAGKQPPVILQYGEVSNGINESSFFPRYNFIGLCTNANMRYGIEKKVSIGRSTVHGWGLFIREFASKGDFIMEYTGELVTDEEGERRGNICDLRGSTYLFSLDSENDIDGTRKGSKARYINNSSKGYNCKPMNYFVSGDYRIGLFADRTIEADEELTFDYGEMFIKKANTK